MKTTNVKTKRESRKTRYSALVAGLLLVGALSALAQTQRNDPTGVIWDCSMSGSRDGVAYIVFNKDMTLSGYSVLDPKPGNSVASIDPVTGVQENTNANNGTAIFGAGNVEGSWSFDASGRILGSFPEFAGSTTNITLTNAISFTGTAVPLKRLTLLAITPKGRVVYSGLPAVSLTNVSGTYYCIKKSHDYWYAEFFTLSLVDSEIPNFYDVVGGGPGYGYSGVALFSRHNKFGIGVGIDPDDTIIRAVVGSFNYRKIKGSGAGWELPSGALTNRLNFNIVRTALPPAPAN